MYEFSIEDLLKDHVYERYLYLFVCDDLVFITNNVAKNSQLTTKHYKSLLKYVISPISWSPDDIHQLRLRPWPDHVVTGHWRMDPGHQTTLTTIIRHFETRKYV